MLTRARLQGGVVAMAYSIASLSSAKETQRFMKGRVSLASTFHHQP
jgi:hypothetical protein